MQNYSDGSFLATKSKRKIPHALGYLSAGEGEEIGNDYELLDINELITRGREGFVMYTVTGESMLEYIKPGYKVFVDPYEQPKNGDVIVSRVNGKNNIKIYHPENRNCLYLIPANKEFYPQKITKKDDFSILGVVKGHLAVY